MRNILGASQECDKEKYLHEDDLCENLHRICTSLPLRFGHVGTSKMEGNFFEDGEVIEKVFALTSDNFSLYLLADYNKKLMDLLLIDGGKLDNEQRLYCIRIR